MFCEECGQQIAERYPGSPELGYYHVTARTYPWLNDHAVIVSESPIRTRSFLR